MRVLCLGGTGTVGSEVTKRLASRGVDVRAMTRSEDLAGTESDGVSWVAGDLAEPDSLGPVFEGADRLHLLTPLHPEEAALGRAAVDAAVAAGVDRVVFHSVHRVEDGAHIPHFASKIEIFEALRESGLPWVTIEPNNYYQNDLWLREAITQMQIYPSPVGDVGLNRVDVRDIADATVNALLDDGHVGNRYPLVGPHALTGEQVCDIWGDALDGTVVYTGDDLDMWEEGAREMFPEWLVEDLRIMFRHFLDEGLLATEEDFATMSHVMGHAPRTFHDFVAETVARWREEDAQEG